MTVANSTMAKRVACTTLISLQFTGSIAQDAEIRSELAVLLDFSTWPAPANTGIAEWVYALNALSWRAYEDLSVSFDATNYPSAFTLNESYQAALVLFQATHDRGALWSGNATYRAASLAMFSTTQKNAIKAILTHWGYSSVSSDLVATW